MIIEEFEVPPVAKRIIGVDRLRDVREYGGAAAPIEIEGGVEPNKSGLWRDVLEMAAWLGAAIALAWICLRD